MRTASLGFCTLATGLVLSTLTISPAPALAERSPARFGHLLTPLGASGPADPIGITTRRLEQRLAQGRSQPAVPLAETVIVGLAGVIDDEPPAAESADAPAAWPRGDRIVLAALAPARSNTLRDASARPWEEPGRLPWAAGPSVPSLLSEPVDWQEAPGKKTLMFDAAVPPPPQDHPSLPSVVNMRAASVNRRLSEPGVVRYTPLPRPPWMSNLPTDPLAALAKDDAEALPPPEFILPIAQGVVTSLFNQGRVHPAIDLAAALGSPVLATTSAQTVTFAGPRGGYGNAVITRDPTGRTHLYGHLQAITTSVGARLEQGEQLGKLGSTGFSTGPHVHYEVTAKAGSQIDPAGLLFPGRRVATGLAWGGPEPDRQVASVDERQPRPR